MGVPKKPTILKRRDGTDVKNPQRINRHEPHAIGCIGDPPAWLSKNEQGIWHEILSTAHPGLLGRSDRVSLEMLVRLIAEMREDWPNMPVTKQTRLSAMLAQFGFTPAARANVIVPTPDSGNKFAQLKIIKGKNEVPKPGKG